MKEYVGIYIKTEKAHLTTVHKYCLFVFASYIYLCRVVMLK